jgi:hypothetical protein
MFRCAQPLHGDDLAAPRTFSGNHARHHGHAVERHRTRAALALGASLFDAHQPSRAQTVEQRHAARQGHAAPVDARSARRRCCTNALAGACHRPHAARRTPEHDRAFRPTCARGAIRDLLQCAHDERLDHGAAIGGAAADVVDGRRGGDGQARGLGDAGRMQRLAHQEALGCSPHARRPAPPPPVQLRRGSPARRAWLPRASRPRRR